LRRFGVLALLSLLFIASFAGTTSAQDERWIISYRVEDLISGQLILERDFESDRFLQNAPMFTGAEYNVTLTLDIGLTAAYANLDLSVDLLHADAIDRFWNTYTPKPNLTDGYNPNNPSISFTQVEGRYVISAFGRVPSDLTLTDLGQGFILHKPVNHTIIRLRGPDGSVLDEIALNIIDSEIDGYRMYLSQREADLLEFKQNGVDPAFTGLYEGLIMVAEEQAEVGFVQTAKTILEKLEVDVPPIKTGPSFEERYFLPVVGGTGLLAVVMAFLFFRSRGKLSFTSMIVEDQIRELEGLSMRASRIDRNLAAKLQEINDRLKELERV
jgi:hypothetical protein